MWESSCLCFLAFGVLDNIGVESAVRFIAQIGCWEECFLTLICLTLKCSCATRAIQLQQALCITKTVARAVDLDNTLVTLQLVS